MRYVPLAVAAALLALYAVPAPVAAQCTLTTSSSIAIPSGDMARPFLLSTELPTAHGLALYQENNGHAGLQRFDAGRDDTCNALFQPDQHIASFKLL